MIGFNIDVDGHSQNSVKYADCSSALKAAVQWLWSHRVRPSLLELLANFHHQRRFNFLWVPPYTSTPKSTVDIISYLDELSMWPVVVFAEATTPFYQVLLYVWVASMGVNTNNCKFPGWPFWYGREDREAEEVRDVREWLVWMGKGKESGACRLPN